MLHLLPTVPGRVLDIGAGTGRDAAALAAMGHRVVAVEPTAELRLSAAALHPSRQIEWLDDSLPDLQRLAERGASFDVVMLSAVWMHLDQEQRRQAMPRVARLLLSGGVMLLSLRHGPVPPGRRMFEVSAAETIRLAETAGLRMVLQLDNQDSRFGRSDVSWTRLAFAKMAPAI
jgi:2-polyprenyl-3-methyl-5-hydroxy-6-metoxy-1,4-benzoquinol methylase